MQHLFLNPDAWMAFLTLVFLEVVLGIDNIIFLSIMSNKAPKALQAKVRNVGLLLAMLGRIALLFGVSLLIRLTKPLFTVEGEWMSFTVNGQSIIILLGGLFLIYKSVGEIHHKLEAKDDAPAVRTKAGSIARIITQIFLLDLVFSIDSVLTAIGMVSFNEFGYAGAMAIMITAIVVTVLIMLFFSSPVSRFVNNHPTVQMLALSFLILIGVTLLVEAGHLAHLTVLGNPVGEIPKGYIYFAILFSLGVETLNLKMKKK
ncbi:MAG: TerC family protein [Dysgonamonadaceae bacterium]|jgi:predicted tellurium resistance membrane protein TerC|nr:TerC family protein [Dysgonamonadaceae bacterium]